MKSSDVITAADLIKRRNALKARIRELQIGNSTVEVITIDLSYVESGPDGKPQKKFAKVCIAHGGEGFREAMTNVLRGQCLALEDALREFGVE